MKLRDPRPRLKRDAAPAEAITDIRLTGGIPAACRSERAYDSTICTTGSQRHPFGAFLAQIPVWARAQAAAYLTSCLQHSAGDDRAPPPKQISISFPGVPRLQLLVYANGVMVWRSDFVCPVARKRTCIILGRLGEMSPTAAVAEHSRIQGEVEEGRDPRTRKMTFGHAVREVFRLAESRGKKSLRDDVSRYRTHLKERLEHLPLGNLNRWTLERTAKELRTRLNPATADRCVALIRAICRDLVELGLMTENPARELKISNSVRPRLVVATEAQLEKLGGAMAAMPPSQLNDFFQFLMVTGLRAGEARHLKFADIDEGHCIATLRETKAGVAQTVPLAPEAMAIIRRRTIARRNEYLFPSRDGLGPMAHPHRAFQSLQQRAGVSGLSLHDLRRGFATAGIHAQGVSVHDVSKLLRHSRTAVTERHYLVADNERLRHAANEASRRVFNALGLDRARKDLLTPETRSRFIDRAVRYVVVSGGRVMEVFDQPAPERAST